jgi:hypothetical protein
MNALLPMRARVVATVETRLGPRDAVTFRNGRLLLCLLTDTSISTVIVCEQQYGARRARCGWGLSGRGVTLIGIGSASRDALDGNRGCSFFEAFTLSHRASFLRYSAACHARIIPVSEEKFTLPSG